MLEPAAVEAGETRIASGHKTSWRFWHIDRPELVAAFELVLLDCGDSLYEFEHFGLVNFFG